MPDSAPPPLEPPYVEPRAPWRQRADAALASARQRSAKSITWVKARFQRGNAGRLALWSVGGVFAALVILVAIAGALDWNLFKGAVARTASAFAGRTISIDGDLDVKVFSAHPQIAVTGLRVGNPHSWPDAKDREMATIPRAFAQIDLWPSLFGSFTLDRLEMDRAEINLIRIEPGKANWSTGSGTKPLKLPLIRHFAVNNGHVNYQDRKRGLTLDASFFSNEAQGAKLPFKLVGDGKLNGRMFKLDFVGASLVNVVRDKPYGFYADVQAGPTHVRADGALAKPFDFGAYRATLKVSGADLADLYYLTGLALPNTPPYNLAGVMTRRRTGYDFTAIKGMIGDTDVHGTLSVDKIRDRPFLTADVASNSLDWDDLATVLGAAPSIKRGETSSPEQKVESARLASQGRMFPDAKLDLKRVRGMDAKVTYSAAHIVAPGWPLRAASMQMTLNEGVMKFNPITLNLNQGKLAGLLTLDASRNVPDVALDMRLTGARLERLIGAAMKEPPIAGPLAGRIRLTGQGDTVRKAAASADGALSFVAPRGQVSKALAELTGINVIKGLGLLLSGDKSTANVRCAVADFGVKDGVARPRTLIVDTEDVLIIGGGSFDLGDETLDLSLRGQPKEPRLIRVRAPIKVEGRFVAPKIGVDTGKVIGQSGIGAALATLVAPIALVLPFIDAGLADDADCNALIAAAKAGKKAPQPS